MHGVKKTKFRIFDIAILAACISILFVQEQILTFLPNIQLTILLLVLYSKKLGCLKTIIITCVHTFLDCLVMGSLNIYYFPFMLLGWIIIPIVISIFFKKCESPIVLAVMGIVFSLLYSWIFIIPNILIPNGFVNTTVIVNYLIADITFEVMLSISSFISILWLYTPCSKVFNKVLQQTNN